MDEEWHAREERRGADVGRRQRRRRVTPPTPTRTDGRNELGQNGGRRQRHLSYLALELQRGMQGTAPPFITAAVRWMDNQTR